MTRVVHYFIFLLRKQKDGKEEGDQECEKRLENGKIHGKNKERRIKKRALNVCGDPNGF